MAEPTGGFYSVLLVLVQRLLWPLVTLGEIFDKYQRSMASTNRVMNLLDAPISITAGDRFLPITIAIAHRLSTIRNADCIYVMEYGELVESGTHERLLEKNGIYAGLWKVQSGVK
jgi:ABC-type multidrug transport system fused ATPase/permease subunit